MKNETDTETVKHPYGIPYYRVRCYFKSRVVSSQIFSDIEEAKAAGSAWANGGYKTFSLSDVKRSPLLRKV